MQQKLNIEKLLTMQSQLLGENQDLECVMKIPINLQTTEGQSWIRAISYRVIQGLVESDLAWREEGDVDTTLKYHMAIKHLDETQLVDAVFYFIRLVVLSGSQVEMQTWDFLTLFEAGGDFPGEDIDDWPSLFWQITLHVGRLNQMLKIDPLAEDRKPLDTGRFILTLRQIWYYLSLALFRAGLGGRKIEGIYYSKWLEKYRRMQEAIQKREMLLKSLELSTEVPPMILQKCEYLIKDKEEDKIKNE